MCTPHRPVLTQVFCSPSVRRPGLKMSAYSSQNDGNDYDALGLEVLSGVEALKNASVGSGTSALSSVDVSPSVQRLLSSINFPADTPPGERWGNLNAVFRHAGTGARVFIGNTTAAKTKAILLQHGITRVVNCKDPSDPNWHENDPDFSYLRFPIAHHWRVLGSNATSESVLNYFGKLFTWVDAQLADGKSVLIHCLAGAHRAGTTGVSYVMHAASLNMTDAVAICQRQRPVVCPIGSFPQLLFRLNAAMGRG